MVTTLALLTAFNVAACGQTEEEGKRKVNPNMTQLYVGNFNGGYGHAWVDEAAKRFEEKFATTSFEEGKEGVQVWIVNGKDEFKGWNFYTSISGRSEDLYIGGEARQEIIDGKLILSLNDILDEPLTEFGETKTIREKLSPYYKESRKLDDTSTECLFLPYAEAYYGTISYDVDLFEEKQLFIKEGGGWTGADNKSVGQDGVAGTYDDGLPSNETEFFELLDRCYIRGVIPMTWTGQYTSYTTAWALNLFMNYDDGVAQKIHNTGYGSYQFAGDSEPTVFNGYDFYKIAKHPGKLAALEQVYKLVKNPNYYSSEAYKTTQSHIEAQDEFVSSVIADRRVAMIIEGTWWENEAEDTFNRLEKYGPYGRYDRRFGVMPTFHISGGTATMNTYMASNMTMFVNANTEHEELSKLFIKYLCTDEIRELFTKVTGCPSPFDYTIGDDTYNSLSHYGKQLWEIHENKTGKNNFMTEDRTLNPAYLENNSGHPYHFHSNVLDTKSLVGAESAPFTFFKYDTTGKTAKQYYDGIITYAELAYDTYYAKTHGARKE